jgi:hypothetical protein
MLAKSSERGSGSLTCSVSRLRRRARGHALNSDAPIRGAVAFPVARKSRQVSGHAESNKIITDIPIGKYMVCPLAKPQADGGFTATVSIYATSEGLNWARQQPTRSASRPQAARGAPGLSIA